MGFGDNDIRRQNMEKFGYKFKKESTCKDCGEAIDWWLTKNGRSVPFHRAKSPGEIMRCHWNRCTKRKGQTASSSPSTANFQKVVQQFRSSSHARVVLVLTKDGWNAATMDGLEPEDVRHELITAANELKRAMGGR